MIKRRLMPIGITMILVIASLLSILAFTATAASVSETKTIPTGETSFSINLQVNESTPYAGIEFALTFSDVNALTLSSFTSIPDGASASPFIEKDGLYYFGFFTSAGSNVFNSGDMLAGKLNFTGYTGSQALTITVVDMTVTRIDANKQSASTKKDSPAYVYSIQREGTKPNYYTVTFDPDGGTRIDGGALSQKVPEGGAVTAPTLTRNGYVFDGWDKTFSNITANITVTAQWTPSYTVTFDPADGTRTGGGKLVQNITPGSAAEAPTLTRSGYTFDGWDKTFKNVTDDMTVTAQWTVNRSDVASPSDVTNPSDTTSPGDVTSPSDVASPGDVTNPSDVASPSDDTATSNDPPLDIPLLGVTDTPNSSPSQTNKDTQYKPQNPDDKANNAWWIILLLTFLLVGLALLAIYIIRREKAKGR